MARLRNRLLAVILLLVTGCLAQLNLQRQVKDALGLSERDGFGRPKPHRQTTGASQTHKHSRSIL